LQLRREIVFFAANAETVCDDMLKGFLGLDVGAHHFEEKVPVFRDAQKVISDHADVLYEIAH
jgi:hypothetical protein